MIPSEFLLMRAAIDSLEAEIAVLDPSGTIIAVNVAWRAFAAVNGGSPVQLAEGINYLAVCDRVAGPDRQYAATFAAGIRAVLAGAPGFSAVYPCHTPEQERWYEGRVRACGDAAPGHVVVGHEDITCRYQTQVALRASEERYRRIVETTQEGIWQLDASDRTAFVNQRMADLLGHAVADLQGEPLAAFLTPEGVVQATNSLVRRRQGLAGHGEIRFRRKDGTTFWASVTSNPLFDQAGIYCGALAMVVDSTARMQAEQVARQNADIARAAAMDLLHLRQEQAGEAAALAAVAAALASTLEPGRLYRTIVEQAARVLPCDHARVTVYEDGRATVVATWGEPRIAPGSTCPAADLWSPAAAGVSFLADTDDYPRWHAVPPLVDHYRERSVMSAPLVVDGTPAAALDISSRVPHFYTDGHRRLAAAFAERAAQAVRNARLYAAEQAARQRSERSESTLRTIITTAPMPILTLDLAGRVRSWNDAAERTFGWAEAEVLGRSLPFIPDEEAAAQRLLFTHAMAGETWQNAEVRRRSKGGQMLDLLLSNAPLLDAAGELVGMVGMYADIGVQKQALSELEAAKKVAEELARARSEFVAAVSHELRTPLTAVIGYAEILQAHWETTDDARKRDQVAKIVAAANRQRRTVDDLLLLSRLEHNGLVPRVEAIALEEPIRRAVDEVQRSYPHQQIHVAGPADLAAALDVERTVQVVANLLDNACKYSAEGDVVTISWGSDGGAAVVRVHDRGPGIPERGLGVLFTRFGRIPGSPIRAGRVGTGLGLYLSRMLAGAMGGELDLEATGPDGSTFRLRLPLTEDRPIGSIP